MYLKLITYFFITFWSMQLLLLLYGIWGSLFNIELNWWFLGGVYFGGIFVAIVNYLIFEIIGIEYG